MCEGVESLFLFTVKNFMTFSSNCLTKSNLCEHKAGVSIIKLTNVCYLDWCKVTNT